MSGRDSWLGLLVLPLLLGCQSSPWGEPNNWTRMKECAEAVERFAKREGWDKGRGDGIGTAVGWQNHYSPKYGRCFVSLNLMNEAAGKNSELPQLYDELFDAFEGRMLAMCDDAQVLKADTFCTIEDEAGPKSDCGACRKYIEDRMRH